MTEVLKAVVAGSQLIVLENVSTFISESELEELHRIIRLYAERGISFIYITAHFEEATYLCDRMALMVNGQIIKTFQRGDPIPDTFPLQSVEEYDRWVRSQHRRQEADTDRQTVLIMDKIQYGNLKDITIRVGQENALYCRIWIIVALLILWSCFKERFQRKEALSDERDTKSEKTEILR